MIAPLHSDKLVNLPKTHAFTAYWTYALAFLGAHMGFMPLFILLLPRRVEMLSPDDAASWLSWLLLIGSVVAGLANIIAGALGDRWLIRFGSRRGLIAIGAVLLLPAYIWLALANDFASLLMAVLFYQVALNCAFSPLAALLADHFPNVIKGRLGGLMITAHPASTLLILPLALLFPQDDTRAFLVTGIVVVLCMVPLLAFWRLGAVISASPDNVPNQMASDKSPTDASRSFVATDFWVAWMSRLFIQTGAAFVFGYIYLYITLMQEMQPQWRSAGASEILAAFTTPAALVAVGAALIAGFISDRWSSRRWPLLMFAGLVGVGMAMLAGTANLVWFLIGFGLLQAAQAAYLAVDMALFAELVSGNARRGMLLGVMNLSNTLPSVIVPGIALVALSNGEDAHIFVILFAALAVAAFLAGGLVLFIRSVR